ncbi:hypothetical protein [Pseudoduganella rhizocola]|uniref:hypothetical protein n=1 Tax=Pseudoduganella rhizocola TaxID=3382643 RepID=UPI0038B63100
MNVKHAILVAACAALAACANTGTDSSGSSDTGDSGSSASTRSSEMSSAGDSSMQTNTAQTWAGTVQSIEPISRQDAGVGVSGSVAAAAAGGSTGTGQVYRVTLRTDDGGSRSINVESMPEYKVGDRVMYSNGALTRQ